MEYKFQFGVVRDNWEFLLEGIWITVSVTGGALAAGLFVGLFLGMMRLSKHKTISQPALWYIELFRNTPALVQLMWVYYALPILTGLELNAVMSCTVALSLNISAYLAEIFAAASRASSAVRSKRRAASACLLPKPCAKSSCRKPCAA